MSFQFTELVGHYRLVVTDELLAFVERTFVGPAEEADRPRIRAEALAEAHQAELLIEADGTVVSRAGGQEFYRLRVAVSEGELEEVAFDKAPGQRVRLRLAGSERVVAEQAGKPNAEFLRVARPASD